MSVIPDEPLDCLQCGYDLRASAGPLCPECGAVFDRQQLREWWNAGKRGTPWERERSIVGFVATWIVVVTSPIQFAWRFATNHDSFRATQFSLVCYAIGAAILLMGGWASRTSWMGPLAVVGGLAGVSACEFLLAALLALLGSPAGIPGKGRPYRFWRGLCHFTSAFTIFSAGWGAATFLFSSAVGVWNAILFVVAPGVIFVWWWATLAVMVCARVRGAIRALLAALIIPIAGGLGILFGYFAAVLCAFAWPF